MLPDLSGLSLQQCVPINANLSEVLRPQGGNENPSVCAICLESLSGDTTVDNSTNPPTDNRWTDGISNRPGRRGPYVRTVCEQDHVYHTGCIVAYAINKGLGNANAQKCPECITDLRPVILELAVDVVAASAPSEGRVAEQQQPAVERQSSGDSDYWGDMALARIQDKYQDFQEAYRAAVTNSATGAGAADTEFYESIRTIWELTQRHFDGYYQWRAVVPAVRNYVRTRNAFGDDGPVADAASRFVSEVGESWPRVNLLVEQFSTETAQPAPAPELAPAPEPAPTRQRRIGPRRFSNPSNPTPTPTRPQYRSM